MSETTATSNAQTRVPFLQAVGGWTVGPVPLVLFVPAAAVVLAAAQLGKLPADFMGGLAICLVLGIALGELGSRIPGLSLIGGGALCALLVPSYLVHVKALDGPLLAPITALIKTSNFFYFYIACIVTGSLLGMQRSVLIRGFLWMFVPLLVGTVAALGIGVLVGGLWGEGVHRTFFFIVIPMLVGGFSEGILPLALAYSEILHVPDAGLLAQIFPAALLGNLSAMAYAGGLRMIGERWPALTGRGQLLKTGAPVLDEAKDLSAGVSVMGAGLLLAATAYAAGFLASTVIPIPGPIMMILVVVLVKITGVIPERLERGAYQLYRFISSSMTFAVLVGAGAVVTPWTTILAAITPAYIAICCSSILAMTVAGFFVGRLFGLYPVESGLVAACHSGMGATGDISILTAANRMVLMPFAQVSTRVGGALTAIAATLLLRFIGG